MENGFDSCCDKNLIKAYIQSNQFPGFAFNNPERLRFIDITVKENFFMYICNDISLSVDHF